MKRYAWLIVLTLAVPGLAHATNLSGTYSIKFTTLCQSIENEVFKPSTSIMTIQEGKISQTIGSITFTPTAPGGLSGSVSASFTQTKGTLAILGLPGPPASPAVPDMQIGTATQTGTYVLTIPGGASPATFKITFKGSSPQTFTAYPSKLTGGSFYHADFINIDGNQGAAPTCSNSGTLDHN